MTGKLLYRYAAIIGCVFFGFANFIACGSQLYQVSMEEDFDTTRTLAANPEADNPESTLYGIHATDGWKKLPIHYSFGTQMNSVQRAHLQAAMRHWEWAVGKKLFKVDGVHRSTSGDKFKDLYSSLNDGVNGHYLDGNWAKTKKPDYVLATTIWNTDAQTSRISKADIRFNDQHYLIGDSLSLHATDRKEVVDMQSLALHELGHLLGLAHVDEEIDSHSIMNPSLFIGEGLTSRQLSRGDIERIQTIYGCYGKACNVDELMASAFNGSANLTDPIAH